LGDVEGTRDLEDPHGMRIAVGIESQLAVQACGGGELVDSVREGHATQILAGEDGGGGAASSLVVGGGKRALGVTSGGIAAIDGTSALGRREPIHGRSGIYTNVSIDNGTGHAAACDSSSSEDGVRVGHAEEDRLIEVDGGQACGEA